MLSIWLTRSATAALVLTVVLTVIPPARITGQVGSTRLDQLTDVTAARVEVPPGWDRGSEADAFCDVAVLVLPSDVHVTGIPIGESASAGRWLRLLGWATTGIGAGQPPVHAPGPDITRLHQP